MKKLLSKTQKRALSKLTKKGKSAYDLGESLSTLNALVCKGFAECAFYLGAFSSPRSKILFFKKERKGR